MDELVQWLGEQLAEDELWAIEASRRGSGPSAEGGVHWHWANSVTDEEIVPNPERESYVGEMAEATAGLRSRETWPTSSGVGDLPQFAIKYPEEVPSAVGGHIIRHDPARVLREIDAKRRLIELHALEYRDRPERVLGEADDPFCAECSGEGFPCETLRLLALPYADRPGYRENWRP